MYSGTSLLEEKVCFLSGKLKKTGRSTFSLAIIDAARVLSLSSPSFKIPISERNDFPFSVSERPELTNLSSRNSNALRPAASSGSEKRIFTPMTLAPALSSQSIASAIFVLGQGHLPIFAIDSSSIAMIAILSPCFCG